LSSGEKHPPKKIARMVAVVSKRMVINDLYRKVEA
jgi:hypothetical protein